MDALVSTDWLAEHLSDADLVIADVRWRPAPAGAGHEAYLESHIPGAVFVDLDTDLAEVPEDPSFGGRHPLPTPTAFCERLADKGIGRALHVVCYDDMGGAIAARLWWMLRWIGHKRVSVLDGGLAKWQSEGRDVDTEDVKPDRAADPIVPRPNAAMVIDKPGVRDTLASGGLVFDARSEDRYRGEGETLDPVGGHIAEAVSAPFADNLDPQTKSFIAPLELRERFRRLQVEQAEQTVCHCGSGVTACHNILAMELAGLGMAKLYVGSWSEWCRDPRVESHIGPGA